MPKFIDKLNIQEENDYFRMFKVVKCGSFQISIQGSQFHYCYPREKLSPKEYSKMEIAIFDSEGHWILPRSDNRLKHKEWADLFEDSKVNSVAGYVPVELIDTVISDLENLDPCTEGRFVDLDG